MLYICDYYLFLTGGQAKLRLRGLASQDSITLLYISGEPLILRKRELRKKNKTSTDFDREKGIK